MADAFGEQIEQLVQAGLGPGWETGGIQAVDESSYVTPRPVGDDRVLITILWPTHEGVAVASEQADVVVAGTAHRWDLFRVGPIGEVVAFIAQEVPRLLAKGRRPWWRRR